MQKRLPLISFWFAALGFLNGILFIVISLFIGGDAVNGKVEAGHYYLFGYSVKTGVKGYTEVSKDLFNYSRWHTYSVVMTWPLVMGALFLSRKPKQKATDGNTTKQTDAS